MLIPNVTGELVNSLVPYGSGGVDSFSFRPGGGAGVRMIHICPSSLSHEGVNIINKDVSLNVSMSKTGAPSKLNALLNMVPSIRIREYAQDSRLNQLLGIWGHIKDGWNAFFSEENKDKSALEKISSALNDMGESMAEAVSGVDLGILQNLGGNISNHIGSVVNFPFILYYQMITTRTTGYYTLPYSGKLVDASNGSEGWETNHGLNGLQTSTESLLGTAINYFGKTIKFNTMPIWGGNTQNSYPSMEVEFDLFNDNVEAAVNNFLFIQTIIPKNKFIQYHIIQHNPCVYDVDIEGFGRFFMCSGDITCNYKGVSRRPSAKFLDRLYSEASQSNMGPNIYYNNKHKHPTNFIRIPDVYSVKLTLKSLLPNNLNNHIYGYCSATADEPNWKIRDDNNIQKIKDVAEDSPILTDNKSE